MKRAGQGNDADGPRPPTKDDTVPTGLTQGLGPRRRARSEAPTLIEPSKSAPPLMKWGGPAVGTLVDLSYRIVGPLGQGGMGSVVLARDERLQRDVAIKFIRPEFLSSKSVRERFMAEARAMARVRHPNVVDIYAAGELGSSPYFVMEYVPGSNLAHWLGATLTSGRLPAIDYALGVLQQVARGVEALHQSGAVHGDVKPGNILIGAGSRIAIADMGLARLLDAGDAQHAGLAGTPAYMAPDFARHDLPQEFKKRADVFALGVLAFELLTGVLPWEAQTPTEMLRVVDTVRPPLPSELRPELTTAFDAPVMAALQRVAEERTGSAADFGLALAAAHEALADAHHDVRIVVADDDEDFRELARETLSFAFPGAQLELVPDGTSALRACQRHPPALAVVDLDMPGLNGIELTAELRKNMTMPIIVVTASGGARDWKTLKALGATGFLVKPLDPFALVALSRKALGRR